MNIYTKKQKIKFALLFVALTIGVAAVWYSNSLVKQLAKEERKKVELWASALQEMEQIDLSGNISPTLLKILESNETIPVILVDEEYNIITSINFKKKISANNKKLTKILSYLKNNIEPIIINFSEGRKNFVYYKESTILTKLFYYPFIQISVITLFIIISYLAFSSSRKAEENQVWVGMSKETAHQLGTPISSLMAWVELMRVKEDETLFISEVEKDILRLQTITERFSKIGSSPILNPENILTVLSISIDYLKTRTSDRVKYSLNFDTTKEIKVPLNIPLFEWVIENICKNAIDAMEGKGKIEIDLIEKENNVLVNISNTGKSIPKSKYKTIFKPGFTTKKRGWGLGLSLAKRIIETYHSGKIFVKSSETNKKTTFSILLKK